MSNIGITSQKLGESIGKNTTIKKYSQEHTKDIFKKNEGEKEKLLKESNLEIKIEQIFLALEKKYPNFNRHNYTIKDSDLGKNYDIYCLFSKKGNLLSYINSKGETILDMKYFEPFKDTFDKSLKNSIGIDYIKKDNGKWYLLLTNKDGKKIEYIEGSKKFNVAVTPD